MARDTNSILTRLHDLPGYHPSTLQTFTDLSTQVGDIIKVVVDGVEHSTPVYNFNYTWGGAGQATIESTGNKERSTIKDKTRSGRSGYGRATEIPTEETLTQQIQKALESAELNVGTLVALGVSADTVTGGTADFDKYVGNFYGTVYDGFGETAIPYEGHTLKIGSKSCRFFAPEDAFFDITAMEEYQQAVADARQAGARSVDVDLTYEFEWNEQYHNYRYKVSAELTNKVSKTKSGYHDVSQAIEYGKSIGGGSQFTMVPTFTWDDTEHDYAYIVKAIDPNSTQLKRIEGRIDVTDAVDYGKSLGRSLYRPSTMKYSGSDKSSGNFALTVYTYDTKMGFTQYSSRVAVNGTASIKNSATTPRYLYYFWSSNVLSTSSYSVYRLTSHAINYTPSSYDGVYQ